MVGEVKGGADCCDGGGVLGVEDCDGLRDGDIGEACGALVGDDDAGGGRTLGVGGATATPLVA